MMSIGSAITTTTPSIISPDSLFQKVFNGFASLRGSPKELWSAYILKFLDSYSYFAFSLIFTLFLSDDFGYSDVAAGTIYGLWGALLTVYGLFAGCLIDNLGVARSLRLGFLITLISRCWIFVTTSRTILLLNVCGLLPLGGCLGIPVLTTGIRRYTNDSNRGFAFGLFYVVMNVAALFSGPTVDACTIWFHHNKSGMEDHAEVGGVTDDTASPSSSSGIVKPWTLSGYRLVILTGIVSNIIAVVFSWTIREIKLEGNNNTVLLAEDPDDEDDGDDVTEERQRRRHPRRNSKDKKKLVSTFTPLGGSPWSIFMETIQERRFWRFLVVVLITINVRMIFRHLDASLPKYMVREFGADVPKGTIYSINPTLIIILVPLVTAATSQVDPLVMIHHGSYISAISVFFLVLSTSIWSSVVFVIVLSIGEAIWSPRLYDYTVSVTKEGREGTYMALSSAPLFLAKLPVGIMSGYLLNKYCPEGEGDDVVRNSKMMWFIIGVTTATSPIFLTVFWNYVSYKDNDADENEDGTEIANVRYTEVRPVQPQGSDDDVIDLSGGI